MFLYTNGDTWKQRPMLLSQLRTLTYFVKYTFSLNMHKQSSAQRTESRLSLSLVCALNTKQEHFILFLFPASSFQAVEERYASLAPKEQLCLHNKDN